MDIHDALEEARDLRDFLNDDIEEGEAAKDEQDWHGALAVFETSSKHARHTAQRLIRILERLKERQ